MTSSNRHAHLVAAPALVLFLATTALAQTDCSAEISEIDRRLATGNYPAEKVQMARQMQSVFEQMCPFLDEAQRTDMAGSIEGILPTLSAAEREDWLAERSAKRDAEQFAERPAQRAESERLKAARDAKKEAARLAELNKPPVSPVLLAPPIARSLAARAIPRDEPMTQLLLWDRDVYEGKLRVLYSSSPNTAQFGLPNWRFYVYLAEMTPAGEITHRLITSKQAGDHAALMLRRGFDEILFQRQVGRPGEPAAMERWSIADRRMLAAADITGRTLSLNGEAWRSGGVYPIATSDGNILYVARKVGTRQDARIRTGWFKFSPGGAQLGSGTTAEIKDDLDVWSSFHTSNGGAGLIVNVTPGVGSGEPTSDVAAAFGILGNAASGKRALIVDGNANLAFTPTVIEGGTPNVSPAASSAAQLNAYRTTVTSNIGPHRLDAVKETSRGYAFLTEVNAGSDNEPMSNGPYLIEFDASGEINEIYLQSIAETLNFKVTNFAPSSDGRFYLHGHGQAGDSHVVLIDREGNPLARSRTSYTNPTKIADLVADASGVWLLAETGYGSDRRLWLERIEF